MSLELAALPPSELAAHLAQPFNAQLVNEERWYGMSHLHDACVKGDIEHVRILVRFGACVNATNAGGETPVHLAARRGMISIAEELRRSGADFHALDLSGNFPASRRHLLSHRHHSSLTIVILVTIVIAIVLYQHCHHRHHHHHRR